MTSSARSRRGCRSRSRRPSYRSPGSGRRWRSRRRAAAEFRYAAAATRCPAGRVEPELVEVEQVAQVQHEVGRGGAHRGHHLQHRPPHRAVGVATIAAALGGTGSRGSMCVSVISVKVKGWPRGGVPSAAPPAYRTGAVAPRGTIRVGDAKAGRQARDGPLRDVRRGIRGDVDVRPGARGSGLNLQPEISRIAGAHDGAEAEARRRRGKHQRRPQQLDGRVAVRCAVHAGVRVGRPSVLATLCRVRGR